MIACALHVMIKKLKEGLEGLQQLLDWLTREVIRRVPKLQKNIPRSEFEKNYDQVGNELKTKLNKKGGSRFFFQEFYLV
ncbi:MAG: hypothetical protein CM1200mP16_08470 [Nitrospina sp.]|nr:MAG: hypothetical protein CM1200mP16_08470 [Nitrospina sp.]